VMTRGGEVARANVLDVAVWLFRQNEFADDADARTLAEVPQLSGKIEFLEIVLGSEST